MTTDLENHTKLGDYLDWFTGLLVSDMGEIPQKILLVSWTSLVIAKCVHSRSALR